MKQIIKMITVFLFIPFLGITQDFDYEVGPPFEVIDADVKEYFYKDDRILSVKVDEKKKVYIQTWDTKSLKELSREVYDDFPKTYDLEGIEELRGKFYLFYSDWNKSKKSDELFVRTINIENGNFDGKSKLLIHVRGKVTNAIPTTFDWSNMRMDRGNRYKGKFNFQKSFDRSKLLIQYRKYPEKRNDEKNHDYIGLNVYDDNLEEISLKEVKMPYKESKMNNLDYSIDSKGNTFILSLVYKDDTQKLKGKKGSVNYRIELMKIKVHSKEIQKTKIIVGEYYLNNIALFNQADDQMICAGFYTKNIAWTIESTDGVVMFRVGENAELLDLKTYEIPLHVLNMYKSNQMVKYNNKRDKKGKAEFQHLIMRKLVVDSEGGLVLIGEQSYVEKSTTNYKNGLGSTSYTYYFNDVLATKINKNGELAWMNKLGKMQSGNNGKKGMSFEYFGNKESNYILFLDNVKNLDLQPNELPAAHKDGKGGFFTAYKIHHDTGEVERVSLFDTRDVKGKEVHQFQVDRIVQISPTEFVVEVYKKKKEDIWIKVKAKN